MMTDRQFHAKTFKEADKLQLHTEENDLDNGQSDVKTTFQSPGGSSNNVQKQSYMGSSATSFFRSPNARTFGKSNLAYKNDIATSDDLNNRDNLSNIDDEVYVEKQFDAKQFIENYTITYQRKKDDEVQALLQEFQNMRKLDHTKPEHAEKWM